MIRFGIAGKLAPQFLDDGRGQARDRDVAERFDLADQLAVLLDPLALFQQVDVAQVTLFGLRFQRAVFAEGAPRKRPK